MNKQTTLEEFEKGMTENLPYLQRNTKEGKYVWTKSHVCNPERSFSRSWKMTLCMWGEEGYVKEATFSLTYDLSLQYAGDNGSAAGIPTETARIPMYRDGVPIATFKGVDKVRQDTSRQGRTGLGIGGEVRAWILGIESDEQVVDFFGREHLLNPMASQWGFALVAQWIGRPPSKRMVVGSNPIQGAFPLVRGFLARAGNPSNKGA